MSAGHVPLTGPASPLSFRSRVCLLAAGVLLIAARVLLDWGRP